ncbi:MAG: HD-GYP domain-containing protein [Actinobacteria bacterium]|nr:HD-GYP domain-containing protein [Actinomycetota bacterium]
MKRYSLATRAYVYGVIFFGFGLATLVALPAVGTLRWTETAVFSLAILVFHVYGIIVPWGAHISVNSSLYYLIGMVFRPAEVVIAVFLGVFLAHLRKGIPFHKALFNPAQAVICVLAGISIKELLGNPTGSPYGVGFLLSYGAMALTVWIVNCMIVAIFFALYRRQSFISTLWPFISDFLPNQIISIVIGFFLYSIYIQLKLVGVGLMFGLLLAFRYSYKVYNDSRNMYIETIKTLTSVIETSDAYTGGHSERVANYAAKIAQKMKLPFYEIDAIHYAALLHDIGKIGISDAIINKPSPLSVEERRLMNDHPVTSYNIVRRIQTLDKNGVAKMVYHHHEFYNGGGYPDGIRGAAIPLGARIIAVADAWDAMTTDRPYRKAFPKPEALKRLQEANGTQFDPGVLKAAVEILASEIQAEESAASTMETIPSEGTVKG